MRVNNFSMNLMMTSNFRTDLMTINNFSTESYDGKQLQY